MSIDELKGKFKSITGGQKSDSTIRQMVNTFSNLCSYADWENTHHQKETKKEIQKPKDVVNQIKEISNNEKQEQRAFDLNYDIHIHLPATRDTAVYDALFSSLAKHIKLK